MQDIVSCAEKGIPDKRAIQTLLETENEGRSAPLHSVAWHWHGGSVSAVLEYGRPPEPPAPSRGAGDVFQAVRHNAEFPYLLYLPPGYDPSRRYPAILFLHGIGERGKAPEALMNYGPFRYILSGHALPFIVMAPVLEAENHWVEDARKNETDEQMIRLKTFVRQMLSRYPADEDRLCLAGLSMGGRGAYKLACALPDTFAAAVICCGRAAPRETPEAFHYPLERLAHLPCWFFHGLRDSVVDPAHTLAAVRKLRALNPSGRLSLTLYPGVGHSCYDFAFCDARLYAWLEEQKRG